jgi:hypothetical protein
MTPARIRRRETLRKLAQRAVIAGVSMLAIYAVGGVGVARQAHADDPGCAMTNACSAQDSPRRPHIERFCQPAGPKAGTHCYQRWVS